MQTRTLVIAPFSSPTGHECRFRLAAGEARSLRHSATIECLSGRVWVTLSGDATDYLLLAGDTLEVGGRLAVLQALEAASVRCC